MNLSTEHGGRTFAIIGGTNRAGTTSLYQYLRDHPEVSVSALKETRFFLDRDYPLPVKYRYGDDPLEKYFEFFRDGAARVFVEASPDYLYSPGTPQRVKECLGDVKWIFVLREPVARLVSWFQYGKQMGVLRGDIGFEEYVTAQLDGAQQDRNQLVLQVLQQGRYSDYLRGYYDCFGRQNVLLLPFGMLQKQPLLFMQATCKFIGIDPAPYQDYSFLPTNVSYVYKRQGFHHFYSSIMHGGASQRLYFQVSNKPAIRKVLHFLRTRVIEPAYLRVNRRDAEDPGMPHRLRRRLDEYYAGELQRLEALSGRKFCWDDGASGANA